MSYCVSHMSLGVRLARRTLSGIQYCPKWTI